MKLTKQFFDNVFEGKLKKQEIKDRLEEAYQREETIEEIIVGAQSMREHMIKINIDQKDSILLDIVGTGGDKKQSFSISTTAAFVAAGAGCRVAKHFNKGVSSKFGSGNLLEKLGVKINKDPGDTQNDIINGIGFMYAPIYHPAMKEVAQVRKELGHRSIFNLLGPLTNPANAKTMLIGAYNFKAAEKIAAALKELGTERAIVVHSKDGLDEISAEVTTYAFYVNVWKKGVQNDTIYPDNYKLSKKPTDLGVKSVDQSADICKRILFNDYLSERENIMKETVIANAGMAIFLNNGGPSQYTCCKQARESIDSGAAGEILKELRRY
jgi:anthranilate phosphoribosyltransferase